MITLAEFWHLTKTRPLWALFFLALGGLIGCIVEVESRPKRCASSDVRGEVFVTCEK
jgi:hypothetical protein